MLRLPGQDQQDQGERSPLPRHDGGQQARIHQGYGSIRIYNATSRLIELEGEALKTGKDLRHTIISNLDDPDNPNNQRIALMGVSFDDLTLADWEAAKLGQIESPFTFNDYQMLDT